MYAISENINRKKAEALYHKYMAMAFESQTKRDRVLFESYYQQAEHYLYLMNHPDECLKAFRSSFKEPGSEKRMTRNPNLKRSSHGRQLYERPDVQMKKPASSKGGKGVFRELCQFW
eukprot:TRINITY_DN2301_c0_g1_i1.p1 TRINITY_DN2301_c0_g1~~TRINITY_DN2301_c0_g1_i1.p1  ORF type:complete len:117 (+),score=4.29 TRINITY_DN2301_c0_g1_i1:202-552(+)